MQDINEWVGGEEPQEFHSEKKGTAHNDCNDY